MLSEKQISVKMRDWVQEDTLASLVCCFILQLCFITNNTIMLSSIIQEITDVRSITLSKEKSKLGVNIKVGTIHVYV